MRLLEGHFAIVLRHLGFAGWDVDPGSDAGRTVLRIRADDFKTITIDSASERRPERVLDHSGESIDRVLRQPRLVQHNPLTTVIPCESEFLEKVGEHVRPPDIERLVTIARRGSQRKDFRTRIRDADLIIPICVFLFQHDPDRLLDIYQESPGCVWFLVWGTGNGSAREVSDDEGTGDPKCGGFGVDREAKLL